MGMSVGLFHDIDFLFWHMSTYGFTAERSCIHSHDRCRSLMLFDQSIGN